MKKMSKQVDQSLFDQAPEEQAPTPATVSLVLHSARLLGNCQHLLTTHLASQNLCSRASRLVATDAKPLQHFRAEHMMQCSGNSVEDSYDECTQKHESNVCFCMSVSPGSDYRPHMFLLSIHVKTYAKATYLYGASDLQALCGLHLVLASSPIRYIW